MDPRRVPSVLGENPPRLESISPNHGLAGASVTISGFFFKGTDDGASTTVLFDIVTADNIVVVDDQTITCDAPTGPTGIVDVTVTTTLGSSVFTGGFEYN